MNMVAGVGGEEREVAVKCDYVVDVEQGWLLLGVVERERVAVWWTDGREMDCRRRADCPQETSSSDAPAPAALFEKL